MDLIHEVTKLMSENAELHKRIEAVRKWTAQFPTGTFPVGIAAPAESTNGHTPEPVKAKAGRQVAFTPAQVADLRYQRKLGKSAKWLAEELGVSLVTIYKYTRKPK